MRVAVIGTGPAGCAAAISLRQLGREVVLLGDGIDGVGEQLHPAARPLLHSLGLTDLPGQLDCVGINTVWDSSALFEQNFLSHPFGNGWLLDRVGFGETLRKTAQFAGAKLRVPSRILGISRDASGGRRWNLKLSDGDEKCDWLVDATGRRGAVARLLGVKRTRIDRQVAIVGWLDANGSDDVDLTLTVEKVENGWWYSCRLPGERRVVGYVTHARPDAKNWEARLRATQHLSRLVQNYRLESPLSVRAADSTILEKCYGRGWIAIGDAALSYDPLASRGLVSALDQGIRVAPLIGAAESQLAAWQANLRATFDAYVLERNKMIGKTPE